MPGWGPSQCTWAGSSRGLECYTIKDHRRVSNIARPRHQTALEKLALAPQLLIVDVVPKRFHEPADYSASQLATALESVLSRLPQPSQHPAPAEYDNGPSVGVETTQATREDEPETRRSSGGSYKDELSEPSEHVAVLHAHHFVPQEPAQPTQRSLFAKLHEIAVARGRVGPGPFSSPFLERKLGYVPVEYECLRIAGVVTCAMPYFETTVELREESVQLIAVV